MEIPREEIDNIFNKEEEEIIEKEIATSSSDGKLKLSDFIPTYPPLSQEHFQSYISSKEEFKELSSELNEATPKSGDYYKHQELILRYMRIYNRILLFHKPGTGKSCVISAVGEYYRRSLFSNDETMKIKKVIILVHGNTLVKEMQKQLICKCPYGREYITKQVLDSKTETSRKNNITRSLKKWYEIKPYGVFINRILGKETEEGKSSTKSKTKRKGKLIVKEDKRMTDAEIKRKYSNCVFVIDEAHYFRNDSSTGKNIFSQYTELWRILHLIENSKIILSTATPMVNDVNDIVGVMNLILPVDLQLDIKKDYTNTTLEEMRPYFEGRISYVRELDVGAIPVPQCNEVLVKEKNISCTLPGVIDIGKKKYNPQKILYKSIMSPFQTKIYRESAEGREGIAVQPRQTSIFVFPDGSYGDKGFEKYTKAIDAKRDIYEFNNEMKVILGKDVEKLYKYSSKAYEIVKIVKSHPRANKFIYSDFVKSGAITIGICLQEYGYEQFSPRTSAFESKTGGGLRPYCASGDSELVKSIKKGITKKRRFALLTPNTNIEDILELFNSQENMYGEYIEIVIGSQTSKEGINLLNIQEHHTLNPLWHQSGMTQAEARGIRSGSHDLLMEAKRSTDINFKTLEIKMYYHSAITNNKEEETNDLKLYRDSERKDIGIRAMERIMKQISIDCQIHYHRNVRINDIDGSAICDYQKCQYKCIDPSPNELGLFPDTLGVDYSTYDLLYGIDFKKSIIADIADIYKRNFILSMDDIQQYFPDIRPNLLKFALSTALDKQEIEFRDRFGSKVSIHSRNPYFYISPNDINSWYYQKNPSVIQNISFQTYIKESRKEEEENIIVTLFLDNTLTEESLKNIIRSLSIDKISSLLERAVKFSLDENRKEEKEFLDENIDLIIKFFIDADVLYLIAEPIESIENKRKSLLSKSSINKQGKKSHSESTKARYELSEDDMEEIKAELADKMSEENVENVKKVYIHTVLDLKHTNTWNRTVLIENPGKDIRIWRFKEKGEEEETWRSPDSHEIAVYIYTLKQFRMGRLSQYTDKSTIFGIHDQGFYRDTYGKFWIRNVSWDVDKRKAGRGFDCENTPPHKIVGVLWDLHSTLKNIPFPKGIPKRPIPIGDDPLQLMRAQLIKESPDFTAIVLDKFKKEQLEFYYQWVVSKVSRSIMCSLLQEFFEKNDLIYTIRF